MMFFHVQDVLKVRPSYMPSYMLMDIALYSPFADDSVDTNNIKWTCSCSSAYEVTQITLIEYNCSEACDCETGE